VTFGLLLASAVAGGAYTLSPGPAFLALLGIGAGQGRRPAAWFMAGHFVGDIVWSSLSLVAILGARSFGTLVFDVLGLLCGLYLGWLGLRAVTATADASGGISSDTRKPLARGLMFGLSNPKAYPVAIAMFTALLSGQADRLGWDAFPWLLGAACLGFTAAYAILLTFIGAGVVRRLYQRHALWVTRISGVLFIGFGLHAIATATPGILRR
jgi:threonine/homoserine/homoserine lactone efflux protein